MDQQAGIVVDWLNLTVDELRKGANDPRSRLPSLFERKWLEVTGEVVPCINCPGIEKKLILLKQSIVKMSKVTSKFRLKAKYNGVYGYKNSEMTDKKAHELAKKHARGWGLFDQVDDKVGKQLEKEEKERLEKLAKEAEKQVGEQKRKTMLDIQAEAEAEAKRKREALEAEAASRSKARLVELLNKDLEWLRNKAKKLKIKTSPKTTAKALAKAIHEKE